MENKRKALGMGLEQLFNNERLDIGQLERDIVETADAKDVKEIALDEIRSNPYQPRKNFDSTLLNELAESIKENGVIQPIIVKKSIKGYELIAGERRVKASLIAGKTKIPAIIRDFTDEQMMDIALLENIQREDLSPIEEAEAYLQIIRKTGLTQDEIGKKFGKTRTYITNLLGILRLPENVKELVNNKTLSLSHAKILSKLENPMQVNDLVQKIIKDGISVRELEEEVSKPNIPRIVKVTHQPTPRIYGVYQNCLREKLGVRAKVKNNKIEIPFTSENELNTIMAMLDVKLDD